MRRRRYPGIAALALVNTVAAAGGAWGLGSGALSLGAQVEARLPWGSTTVGAAALFLAWPFRTPCCPRSRGGATGVRAPQPSRPGLLLVGWIVVELAFIRELSFFHPLYAAVGVAMVWLGRRLGRTDAG